MAGKSTQIGVRRLISYKGKRTFDLLVATGLAIPATPLMFLSAIIVYLECGANPFFVQERIGLNGNLFRLIKLRTMRPNTANLPSHEITGNQMLKSGAWLRRYKVDELPQIINIFKGEMSFVGPRPCLPSQNELIDARQSRGVDHLMPGITGTAQIAGIDMSTPLKLAEADSAYRSRLSLAEDITIMLRTFFGAGRGDAVKSDQK
jgi:O-antigen biosynthesis protein WbqP